MAYTKQTFTSGQILKASDLNTMSQGIVDKQDKLVSGTSLKTINGQSLLGSGDIAINSSGSSSGVVVNINKQYNPLSGLKVSIMGDSISTFQGWIKEGYRYYYPKGDVTDVSQTWWKQIIDNNGMVLGYNASYSGSSVQSDSYGVAGVSD